MIIGNENLITWCLKRFCSNVKTSKPAVLLLLPQEQVELGAQSHTIRYADDHVNAVGQWKDQYLWWNHGEGIVLTNKKQGSFVTIDGTQQNAVLSAVLVQCPKTPSVHAAFLRAGGWLEKW